MTDILNPRLLAELGAVLAPGETLEEAVEALLRAEIQRRRERLGGAEDLDFPTLYQARGLEHVLERLRTSTPPDSRERATLVAFLEKLLPDPEPPRSLLEEIKEQHQQGVPVDDALDARLLDEVTRAQFAATACARRERFLRDPSTAVSFDEMVAHVRRRVAEAQEQGLIPKPVPIEQLSMGYELPCVVLARWDADASVWVATSDDVPGLATEATTMDALRAKLRDLVPALLRANAAQGLTAVGGEAPDMRHVPRRRPEPEPPEES
jgi:hypothetical protein